MMCVLVSACVCVCVRDSIIGEFVFTVAFETKMIVLTIFPNPTPTCTASLA